MSQGMWVLILALALATAFGLWRAARDGRFRGTRALPAAVPSAQVDSAARVDPAASGDGSVSEPPRPLAGLGRPLGERATLLQFSSAFCAPCRATRRVLGEVVELVPGVAHVEVDAEQHLDLVRSLGIVRTPTTLVLDASGREVSRASGAPSRDAVMGTLLRAFGDV